MQSVEVRKACPVTTLPAWGLIAALLPCPLELGWITTMDVTLPETHHGTSALSFDPAKHRLWLLSDLPDATLSSWTLPTPRSNPRLLSSQQLQSADTNGLQLDSEAMVIDGDQLWIASEGRASPDRAALLLRFALHRGALVETVALPREWQPEADQGLESNAGPESLARLSPPKAPLELLMASERPLRQDPPDQVRLLRWFWPPGSDRTRAAPQSEEHGALRGPAESGWGLTDLLVLHPEGAGRPQLLSLWRRHRDPLQWDNQLRLYPLPTAGTVVDALEHWDLQAIGLTPENWEGIAVGPLVSPGQPSLLLVSDDNRNPLQSSRMALLLPRRAKGCVGAH